MSDSGRLRRGAKWYDQRDRDGNYEHPLSQSQQDDIDYFLENSKKASKGKK